LDYEDDEVYWEPEDHPVIAPKKQKLSLTNKKQKISFENVIEVGKFGQNNDSIASNKSQVSMQENCLNDSITNA
jgi:hypothetical protein